MLCTFIRDNYEGDSAQRICDYCMCMNSIQELVTLLLRQGNMSIECEYHLLSILLSKGSVIGIATVACNKKYFLKHDTGIMIIIIVYFIL